MRDPRVAILVDHPQRDLGGATLLALALCARGATTHLVPANLAPRELWALAPDLVLLNYLRRSNEALGASLAAAGVRLGLLDTEGGVWASFESYRELLWRDAALRARTAVACLWGPRMAHDVTSAGVLPAACVHVTGCPRFDLHHPDWRTGPQVPAAAPRILVNTNFSTVNPRFTTVERKIATSRENFGWSMAEIARVLDTERAAIDATVELCRRLAHDFPDAGVLLRPHPFEDERPYREALADVPAATVDGSGPVDARIAAAAVVIQRSCTTAVEAGLVGRPTLSPRWIPAPFEIAMAESVSVPCEDYQAMRAHVAAVLAGRHVTPPAVDAALAAVTRDYFHVLDGDAHARAADAVIAALDGERTVRAGACADSLYHGAPGLRVTSPAARAGMWTRRLLRLAPDRSLRRPWAERDAPWVRTAKYFGPAEVGAIAGRLLAAPRARSRQLGRVDVALARERGECAHGFHGHAVTIAPASRPVAARAPAPHGGVEPLAAPAADRREARATREAAR